MGVVEARCCNKLSEALQRRYFIVGCDRDLEWCTSAGTSFEVGA